MATATKTTDWTVKRFGNKNAWIITRPDGVVILRSYDTPVAAVIGGVFYQTAEKYSTSTTRQIREFWRQCWQSEQLSAADGETRPPAFFYDLADTPDYHRTVRYWPWAA